MDSIIVNCRAQLTNFLISLFFLLPGFAHGLEWTVAMTSSGKVIEARGHQVKNSDARTVLLIGGVDGSEKSSAKVRQVYDDYVNREDENKPFNLVMIPMANPDGETLVFPPQGRAYQADPVSFGLWRWIAVHGPDLVLIESEFEYDLADALSNNIVADVSYVPALHVYDEEEELETILSKLDMLPVSPARKVLESRLTRTPLILAEQLSNIYGNDFNSLTYIPGMAIISKMRLGLMSEVEDLLAPYLSGKERIIRSSLNIAAHLVFAEMAERTGNLGYLNLALEAADMGFDDSGNMLEVMPLHGEMSDAFFMATPLLAKVGKLSGDEKYFDLAAQHVEFMNSLVLREDGLYQHSPETDAAWSRGNAFVALGLALSLSEIPESHQGFNQLLTIYRDHLEQLVKYQDQDGMWHQVIDYPGSYAEFSSTSMIAAAMQRGIYRGWLDAKYKSNVDKAWQAVLLRSNSRGYFVNVCESTNKQYSLEDYLNREAKLGRDDRAGAMLMFLATELAGLN